MNIKIVSIRRWLIMMVLSISGGTIYFLPILQEVYYQPLATALNLDNTQVGSLVSIFGVFAMLSYLPGGWVADKVSPRILLSSSLLLTGFLGLYFATLPSYPMSLLIHAIWGITTSLLFWGAVVRVTRNWASADDQGKAFGFLQTGRGLVEILVSMAILAVFGYLGGTNFALSVVITLFSILIIFSGILSWIIIKDDDDGKYSSSQFSGSPIRDIITVLKLPVVWLIAIVVLAAYSAYWGTYRFTSYSSDIFGMSIIMAGVIGVGKMWMNPPAAFMAGFIADKNGIAKSVSVLFIILVISFVIFAFMPGIPSLIPMMIINIAIASFAVFALRGIYFALLEEGGVPKGVTGTAAGFISMIGFTPDIFMPLMGGILLDTLPGDQGYRYFFLIVAGICFIGCMASVTIYRQINNKTAR
jgi:sugar phosphate permease